MFKLFRKKSKKGFTLAELLVVVAIIAILVAIAVPIFTHAMEDAQLRTNQANIRSVRAAGVTEILTNWSKYSKAGDKAAKGWLVYATVSQTGQINKLTIWPKETLAATDTDGIIDSTDNTSTPESGYKTTDADIKLVRADGSSFYWVRAAVTEVATAGSAG